MNPGVESVQRIVLAAPRSEPIREAEKILVASKTYTTACWTILSSSFRKAPPGPPIPSSMDQATDGLGGADKNSAREKSSRRRRKR
jgi:hypothetical protein